MSLTHYLKQKLGITLKEASLVEAQVKGFTEVIKKEKVKKSVHAKPKMKESFIPRKRSIKEEDEMAVENDMSLDDTSDDMSDSELDVLSSDLGTEDDSSMLAGEDNAYADNEVEMIKIQLKSIVSDAESLMNSLDHEENIDAWIQSKITLAQDYLNSVHDYVVYGSEETEESMGMEEPSMDMGEESAMEEPVEESSMEEAPAQPMEEKYDNLFKKGFVSF